jgi:toxin ParE1/3/4
LTRVVLTDSAGQDRLDIWLYVAADNLDAADHLLDESDETLRLLAGAPGLGRARDDIAPGLRYFPVGNYLILYEALPDGITVVRLVHGARHLAWLLG